MVIASNYTAEDSVDTTLSSISGSEFGIPGTPVGEAPEWREVSDE